MNEEKRPVTGKFHAFRTFKKIGRGNDLAFSGAVLREKYPTKRFSRKQVMRYHRLKKRIWALREQEASEFRKF